MNKALHVFVYLFLILAGAALWFEIELNAKRTELVDRNLQQEKYYFKIARTIEKDKAPSNKIAIKKDDSEVRNEIVDQPEMKDMLEWYDAECENDQVATFDWKGREQQMRTVYQYDADGKPVLEGGRPVMEVPGTEWEMLEELYNAAKDQQARLNTTRANLRKMRENLSDVVAELNELKPIARQDKVTIDEKTKKIGDLETEKTELNGQIVRLRSDIDDLNGQITSKNDEIARAKEDLEAKNEELVKEKKLVARLNKLVQDLMNQAKDGNDKNDLVRITVGDKAKVVEVDNANMFAIVEFTPEAMMELKGRQLDRPLPVALTLGVKRPNHDGVAGEFIGRLRLRQEVKGQNLVICDILGDWAQEEIKKDDVVFAD